MNVRFVLVSLILAVLGTPSICSAQGVPRVEGWELTANASYQLQKDIEFVSGPRIELTDEFGLGAGVGYRLSQQLEAQFSLDWNSVEYRGTLPSVEGTVESVMPRLNGVLNFMEGAMTPYVSAGIGWTWIDTDIPQLEDGFTYQIGLGLRWDVTHEISVKFAYERAWVDMGQAAATLGLDQLKLVFAYRE
jgi:opacity protein-like surface antigen